jgi:hypothetical protein
MILIRTRTFKLLPRPPSPAVYFFLGALGETTPMSKVGTIVISMSQNRISVNCGYQVPFRAAGTDEFISGKVASSANYV